MMSADWQSVLFANVMVTFRFRAYRKNGKKCRVNVLVRVARYSIAECVSIRVKLARTTTIPCQFNAQIAGNTAVDDRAKTAVRRLR